MRMSPLQRMQKSASEYAGCKIWLWYGSDRVYTMCGESVKAFPCGSNI